MKVPVDKLFARRALQAEPGDKAGDRGCREVRTTFWFSCVAPPSPTFFSLTRVVKIFVFIIAPLLLIAAAIKAFITPLFMGLFAH